MLLVGSVDHGCLDLRPGEFARCLEAVGAGDEDEKGGIVGIGAHRYRGLLANFAHGVGDADHGALVDLAQTLVDADGG